MWAVVFNAEVVQLLLENKADIAATNEVVIYLS
jgi:ankyrin repeat protein